MNLIQLGYWAFIGGLIVSVLASFVTVPYLLVILFVLGLIVGFLNIKGAETTPFLVAVSALLLIGVAGLQLGELTPWTVKVLNALIAFVSAVGLVVAIRQILVLGRPNE